MTALQETDLMRAIILVVGFKEADFHAACAALIYRALAGGDFTAACLPHEITKGDIHVSGLAVKMLQKCELIAATGYLPSPDPAAKGRILRSWRIAAGKESTARVWLSRHGYPATISEQQSLAI